MTLGIEGIERDKPIELEVRKQRRALMDALNESGQEGDDEIWEEIAHYGDRIKKTHPEHMKVAAFHALIGSQHQTSINDFDGEDSVLHFLANLRRKHLGTE